MSKYDDAHWAEPGFVFGQHPDPPSNGFTARDARHAFEAASVGYLALNWLGKWQARKIAEETAKLNASNHLVIREGIRYRVPNSWSLEEEEAWLTKMVALNKADPYNY